MQNGWTNVNVRCYRDRSGIVHLEGRAAAPAGGGPHPETIFTLPAGYRPGHQALFVYSRGGLLADLLVEPDGRVRPNDPPPADGDSVRLEGISFRPGDS